MDARVLTARRIMPMIGGATAAATAMGAWAPAVQIAGANPDGGAATLGAAGVLGAGTFEPCSTYFGYGKDEGVLDVVAFDVNDQNGDDGVDHAVPDDTEVVLVLDTEEGGTIECTPEEISEEDWDDYWFGQIEWPGPGHYPYPSVNLQNEIEELPSYGEVNDVGFRVTSIPGGEHSLVDPEDVRQLVQHFADLGENFEDGVIDPRIFALIEAEVDADAADAYEDFLDDCYDTDFETDPSTDEAVIAAVEALLVYLGDPTEVTEVPCFEAAILAAEVSEVLSGNESVAYVEEIVLALPEEPTPTPTPTPPAAQPTPAAPNFTG